MIIVDELDRCKPTFSVELVEKIKHFFSAKKVVFLLVMNKKQLEESVKCVYGQGIDAHTYLQKFIHLETNLPKNNKAFGDDYKYAQRLQKLHGITFDDVDSGFINYVESLGKHLRISLRQLEKVFVNLTILQASLSERDLKPVPALVLLSFVKVLFPEQFQRILYQEITYQELHEKLNMPDATSIHGELEEINRWMQLSLIEDEYFGPDTMDKRTLQLSDRLYERFDLARGRVLKTYGEILNSISLNQHG